MSQLPADRRETWITGIGLVSSLGDGLEANWDALCSGRVNIDLEKYAPWMIHPLVPLNLDSQIPKKGDQRQMEAWQRIGTYAAGLALDSAGIKDDKEILARTDMIVAAGGGERDLDVDAAILTARADARSGALNERLMNDLRPTLFLAQLSNLLAGNISIVHGVSGSSRTFMGEESRGRRCHPDCMGEDRLRTERGCLGRRRAQWRAQGNADALRMRRLQSQEGLRISLVP